MLNVLGIGDNVCDIYINADEMYPGGQALNFAVYAKQLGVHSAYMGVFGDDEVAGHVLHTLDEFGIDRKYCRHYMGENGYAVVNIVDGDRVFVKSNRGGVLKENPIRLNSQDKAYIKGFDLVHTSNNSYFNDQLHCINELGVPLSYDFSNKWEDWSTTENICPFLDYGFLSCGSMPTEEVKAICSKIHELGCRLVIATMGGKGAWLYDGEVMLFQPARTIQALDTLGAGDSLATSFLIHYLQEKQEHSDEVRNNPEFREKVYERALSRATEFAAQSCLVRGAFGHGIEVPESVQLAIAK